MYSAEQTASILGGEAVLGVKVRHDYDLEKLVIKGLPYQTIDLLIERIYPDDKKQRWLIISPSTYRRRQKSGYLTMFESERVERIARIYGIILSVWEGEEEPARRSMQTKHRLLDNRSPFEASLSELGARQVESILFRIEYGIFY